MIKWRLWRTSSGVMLNVVAAEAEFGGWWLMYVRLHGVIQTNVRALAHS